MRRTKLSLMLIGLALITTTAGALDKAKATYKSSSNRKVYRAKDLPAKKTGPAGKFTMAELTKNIEYDFAKASVRTSYNAKLDQLAEILVQNKSALTLRGYADSIGSYKGNWVISDKRATAVKNYLITKGVDADKIVATPFGSANPVASNKTKAGRQKNRRVEIKVNDISN